MRMRVSWSPICPSSLSNVSSPLASLIWIAMSALLVQNIQGKRTVVNIPRIMVAASMRPKSTATRSMSEERSIGAEALNEGLGFISLYAMSFKIVKQDTALGRGNFIPGYVVLYDGRFDEFFRYQATAERYVERRKEELSRDA